MAIFTISDLFSIVTPTIILALLDDMQFERFHRKLIPELCDVGGSEKKNLKLQLNGNFTSFVGFLRCYELHLKHPSITFPFVGIR